MPESIQPLLGTLTADIIGIFVVFVALIFYNIRYGKGRSIALILSLYVALLLFTRFPFLAEIISEGGDATTLLLQKAGVFIGFVILAHIILRRLVFAEFPMDKFKRFLQSSLLALAALALLLAFSYHVLPVTDVVAFSDPVRTLFADSQFFFWWLVGPLVLLFFTTPRGL